MIVGMPLFCPGKAELETGLCSVARLRGAVAIMQQCDLKPFLPLVFCGERRYGFTP
jgi:hypothetical protein